MKTIVMALLILTPAALLRPCPDPGTVLGHLETCPKCSDLESNPTPCKALVTMSRRNYQGGVEIARRHPR